MKFARGGHGYGLADYDPVLRTWADSSLKWLDKLGFFKSSPTALTPFAGRVREKAHRRSSWLQNRDSRAFNALGRLP
jgi:hypothetical protein